jgi:outer membrane immunogenic protein
MKTFILAGAALSALCLSTAPAHAQAVTDWLTPITGYGALGYSMRDDGGHLGAVTGRLGLRYGRFLGTEAEGSFGVKDHDLTLGGLPYEQKLDRSVAAYAVGYVPILPRFDLFGRVGLGNTKLEGSIGALESDRQRDTLNYGGGAQYFFTGHDGLRADYTVEDYRQGPGHANVWNVSYVRKF